MNPLADSVCKRMDAFSELEKKSSQMKQVDWTFGSVLVSAHTEELTCYLQRRYLSNSQYKKVLPLASL